MAHPVGCLQFPVPTHAVTLTPNQLHQGDCIKLLSKIDAGSVDLVFADPPFNIGYEYDVYDDEQSANDYLAFCRGWISGVHRALTDDGSFWLAIGDEYAAELKLLSQEIGFQCRSWVIWYYTFGVNCVRGFSRSHTHLFHFVKDGDNFTFNGDNPTVRVPSARQLVYADARANAKGRLPDNTWILRPQDAPQMGFSPSHDTWYFARVAGTFKEREGFHGCQMPEQLLGRIIRVSSSPGDLVLDPFGGSGTTLVVAKKLGRRYMGFELSKDYAKQIKQRLKGCQSGDPLDGPEDPVRSAPTTRQGKKRTEFRNGRPLIPLDEKARKTVNSAFSKAAKQATRKEGLVNSQQVLCDPDRNLIFVNRCKEAKLLGDARTWNEFLLKLSGEKTLKGEGKKKKASIATIESVCNAAEIAFQMLSVDYGMDLETLLSSPDAAKEFDSIVSLFGGDISSVDCRTAIWNLKRLATGKRVTSEVKLQAEAFLEQPAPESQPLASFLEANKEQEPVAGVFALSDPASVLYIGQSGDIAQHLRDCLDLEGWRKFDIEEIQTWPVSDPKQALALRCLLVTREKPWLNAHFMHHPVTTTLF